MVQVRVIIRFFFYVRVCGTQAGLDTLHALDLTLALSVLRLLKLLFKRLDASLQLFQLTFHIADVHMRSLRRFLAN